MTQVIMANKDEVAAKSMDGEAILINLTTGIYYTLDDVGSFIWNCVEAGSSVDTTTKLLAEASEMTPEQVASDVQGFIDMLLEENLAMAAEADEGVATPEPLVGAYVQPQLEKYDDMAEMFALDPPLPGINQNA